MNRQGTSVRNETMTNQTREHMAWSHD